MSKEEIREYLDRVERLEIKLLDEDKETLQWLIFGYNQCAKLLQETEQKIDKAIEILDNFDAWLEPQDILKIRKCVEILKGERQ